MSNFTVFPGEKMFDINLTLNRGYSSAQVQEWWIVNQTEPGPLDNPTEKSDRKLDWKEEAGLRLYIFSDQVSPPSLGFLAGYGFVPTDKYGLIFVPSVLECIKST